MARLELLVGAAGSLVRLRTAAAQSNEASWTPPALRGGLAWTLATDPVRPSHLYAAAGAGGGRRGRPTRNVSISADARVTWSWYELPGLSVRRLVVDPAGVLFAATQLNGLHRSRGGG